MNGLRCCCLFLCPLVAVVADSVLVAQDNIPHSRRRRHLVFPEGSSLQLVFCLTLPIVKYNPDYPWWLATGWTAGVTYQLPSHRDHLRFPYRKPRPPPNPTLPPFSYPNYHHYYETTKPWKHTSIHWKHRPNEALLHRHHRRDLYSKLETLFETAKLGGRACVLRALCEAGQREVKGRSNLKKGSFASEILHVVFTLPPAADDGIEENEDIEPGRSDILELYDRAHSEKSPCDEAFMGCSSSIFELFKHN